MLSDEDRKLIDMFDECPIKPHFIAFIEFRRGKGEKVGSQLILKMKNINNILSVYGTDTITREMADEVFASLMDSDGLVHHNLLSTMRAFTIYLATIIPETFVVPQGYWNTRRIGSRYYTFTQEEIIRIVDVIDSYCRENSIIQKRYDGAPPYPIIVRLLAGTGMRVSEILNLTTDNMNLEEGVISINDGKGHISRYIPLSMTLSKTMRTYYGKRKAEIDLTGYYFLSERTQKTLSRIALANFFQKRFAEAGIQMKNGEKPVIHTFRHTFCTMALDRLIDGGMHPDAAVPLLAAYVGHNDLRVTYRYLHMTENRIETTYQNTYYADLIPEDTEDSYEW